MLVKENCQVADKMAVKRSLLSLVCSSLVVPCVKAGRVAVSSLLIIASLSVSTHAQAAPGAFSFTCRLRFAQLVGDPVSTLSDAEVSQMIKGFDQSLNRARAKRNVLEEEVQIRLRFRRLFRDFNLDSIRMAAKNELAVLDALPKNVDGTYDFGGAYFQLAPILHGAEIKYEMIKDMGSGEMIFGADEWLRYTNVMQTLKAAVAANPKVQLAKLSYQYWVEMGYVFSHSWVAAVLESSVKALSWMGAFLKKDDRQALNRMGVSNQNIQLALDRLTRGRWTGRAVQGEPGNVLAELGKMQQVGLEFEKEVQAALNDATDVSFAKLRSMFSIQPEEVARLLAMPSNEARFTDLVTQLQADKKSGQQFLNYMVQYRYHNFYRRDDQYRYRFTKFDAFASSIGGLIAFLVYRKGYEVDPDEIPIIETDPNGNPINYPYPSPYPSPYPNPAPYPDPSLPSGGGSGTWPDPTVPNGGLFNSGGVTTPTPTTGGGTQVPVPPMPLFPPIYPIE